MHQKEQKKTVARRRIRPGHLFLSCLLVVGALSLLMLNQQSKLNAISEQQAMLQAQLDKQILEEQRLEHMQEYVQTDEYLAQFAREKFGYVLPEDYKFYREEAPNE